MTDRFGALTLPVQVGGMTARLEVLLAFAKAVLISQAQAAWAGVAPLEPNQIVAMTRAESPKSNPFVERLELPALFAFEMKGTFDGNAGDFGDGFDHGTSTISLWWLFPPAMKENDFDPTPATIARVLAAALRDARHSAWVAAADVADVDAVRLVVALPVGDTTYAGASLDGAIGAADWPTPGRVTLTKSAGTWDTALPVAVTVVLVDGTEHTEELYFTSAANAETIEAAWIGAAVISLAVPGGQTGTLSAGSALAPACEHGSSLREHMAVHRLALTSWERKELAIDVRAPAQAQKFDGVLFSIEIEETRDRTGAALAYATLDADGARGLVTSVDGSDRVVSAEVYEA